MDTHAKARKARPVGTLTKTIRLLEFVTSLPKGMCLKDISEHTGLNKSTAYRLMAHLEHEGYLARDGARNYVMGTKILELARRGNWVEGLRVLARPLLLDLGRETGETVNLAILDGDALRYLEVIESPHSFPQISRPGMHRPLYCTALGKAIVAFLPTDERERLLNGLKLTRHTSKTMTSLEAFRHELTKTRERGFALDDEETIKGARCIAAPVLDSQEYSIAAVSVAGPVSRITQSRIAALAQAVQATAALISGKLQQPRFWGAR